MASYLSRWLLAPQSVSPYLAHVAAYWTGLYSLTCKLTGARYWD